MPRMSDKLSLTEEQKEQVARFYARGKVRTEIYETMCSEYPQLKMVPKEAIIALIHSVYTTDRWKRKIEKYKDEITLKKDVSLSNPTEAIKYLETLLNQEKKRNNPDVDKIVKLLDSMLKLRREVKREDEEEQGGSWEYFVHKVVQLERKFPVFGCSAIIRARQGLETDSVEEENNA